MSATSIKRIQAEYRKFTTTEKKDYADISLYNESNFNQWKVIIAGPAGSPFEGGKFEAKITIPPEYPHKAPEFKLITKIYSPAVSEEGSICIPILQNDNKPENWVPTRKVMEVIDAFRNLIADLTSDHVSNAEIAAVLAADKDKFIATAKEWTKKYAK